MLSTHQGWVDEKLAKARHSCIQMQLQNSCSKSEMERAESLEDCRIASLVHMVVNKTISQTRWKAMADSRGFSDLQHTHTHMQWYSHIFTHTHKHIYTQRLKEEIHYSVFKIYCVNYIGSVQAHITAQFEGHC